MGEYFGLGSPPSKQIDRNAIIEECARVAEQWGYSDVVFAIRALKAMSEHEEYDYARLEAEIERLRALLSLDDSYRAAIIEECARAAERYWIAVEQGEQPADGVGDAIRALKDKP